jgi:septation ring formation regulator EzrA
MTEDTKRQQDIDARSRIAEAKRNLQHSKVQLEEMAKVLEKIVRMLRTVPTQFHELFKDQRDNVARTRSVMAKAALDYAVVAAAVDDFEEAKREYAEAVRAGAMLGVVDVTLSDD